MFSWSRLTAPLAFRLSPDSRKCWDQQPDQDHRAAVQQEIREPGRPEVTALWPRHDHDRSGSGRLAHQRPPDQLHPQQLARPAAPAIPGRIHHAHCEGQSRAIAAFANLIARDSVYENSMGPVLLTEFFLSNVWPKNRTVAIRDQPQGLSRLRTCQGEWILSESDSLPGVKGHESLDLL